MNNAVGYARPARFANPVALGTDGIGADMLDEFRVAFARHREDDVTASRRRGLGLAGRRAGRCSPRRSTTGSRWSYAADGPVARWPTPPTCARSRSTVDGEVVLADGAAHPGRPRRDPGQGRRGQPRGAWCRPTWRSLLIRMDDRRRPDWPSTCRTPTRSARAWSIARYAEAARLRGGVAGREPAGARGHGAHGRLPVVHRHASRSARGWSTTGPATPPCWPRPSPPSTTWPPAGSSSASAPGGIRWPPRWASPGTAPLTAMRETIEAVRALLADETVTYHGEFVHLDGVELDYVHQERRPKDVPIYLGRHRHEDDGADRRDRRRRACSTTWSRPPTTQQAMRHLEVGARPGPGASLGRHRPAPAGGVLARRRPGRALDNARLLVTQYLGQQPHIMKASGVPESLLDEIGQVLTWPATHDQVVAASKLVPDDVVQMITASGTADECRAKVAEYVDAGATCPILYPLGRRRARHDRRLRGLGAVTPAGGAAVQLVGPGSAGRRLSRRRRARRRRR